MEQHPLSPEAQEFVDEVTSLLPGSIGDGYANPESRNSTMAHMVNTLVEKYDPHVGWWNEEDPESMIEVTFHAPDDATFEDGVLLGELVYCIFTDWAEFQTLTEDTARLLFDNPDELAPGDRVVHVDADRRPGKVVETEREDEDEPRSLRVLIDFDDSEEVGWVYRFEVERE